MCFAGVRNHLPVLEIDSVTKDMWSRYSAKPDEFLRRGLSLGRTPLAILSRDLGDRRANPYFDMDFWSESRKSVFRPRYLIDELRKQPNFRYQRKLMAGGACEATTFAGYGYQSTCICLPLGNYHNMRDIDDVLAGVRPARVGPEYISVSDYHGMIDLLLVCAARIDDAKVPSIRSWMDGLYRQGRGVVVGKRPSD